MNIKSKKIKAVILTFFVLSAFAVAFRLFEGGLFISEEKLDIYEIHFRVKDISSNSVKYFRKGDTVTFDGGVILGSLEGTYGVTPTEVYVTDNNGKLTAVSYPENTRVDIYGSILAYGKYDGGFYLNGERHIASGDSFSVSTECLDVAVTVTEIVRK